LHEHTQLYVQEITIVNHREEAKLTIELHLQAEFAESYEGDADGYAWLRDFRAKVQPQLLQAVAAILRDARNLEARPFSRGRNPEEHVEIQVNYVERAATLLKLL
jgi:hypothetical protein